MAESPPPPRLGLLARLARSLAGLRGWRRHGTAIACGLLASLALPPLHWLLALFPAMTALIWLLDGAERPWRAALIGWSFGFGYFLAGLYWVGIAFFVDAERFALLMPLGVGGLAAGIALFPGLALYLVARAGVAGAARICALAAAWVLTEWLRSWLFTGFSWNLLGTVWTFSPAMLQLAAVGGVWALSALAFVAAAAPALWGEPPGLRPARQRWCLIGVLLGLPLAIWVAGSLRLAAAPAPEDHRHEDVRLRIVQPAIPQRLKWQTNLKRGHVVKQMRLSANVGIQEIDHLVWAETAVPYFLAREPGLRELLARTVPPGGYLLTGAPRLSGEGDESRLWNSLHALTDEGEIAATYDKFHLVPFGEYIPFRRFLPWAKLTAGSRDFQAGPGPVTLELGGLPPFSPLICYEVIFPGAVRASTAAPRPDWLLNITNDAWFGISSGPHQHFAAAQLRAVEEGLPLVRAANNGISGLIDGYGRVLAKLGLDESGHVDVVLPRPAESVPPFARLGSWALAILLVLLVLATWFLRRLDLRAEIER